MSHYIDQAHAHAMNGNERLRDLMARRDIVQKIQFLREAFGSVKTMDPTGEIYKRLCQILDRASDEALEAAYYSKIRFVSQLSFNRMIKRGLV